MQYLSTRGGITPIPFTKAVMMGLAEDGGLLLPRTIPRIGSETLHFLAKTELCRTGLRSYVAVYR